MIVRRGGGFQLMTRDGSRALGPVTTYARALGQERAIHARQHARRNPANVELLRLNEEVHPYEGLGAMRDRYAAVLVEVVRQLGLGIARLDVRDPAAAAEGLARLVRDAFAAELLARLIEAGVSYEVSLYLSGRRVDRGGARMTLPRLQAHYERYAAALERWLRAIAAFERRPEVHAASARRFAEAFARGQSPAEAFRAQAAREATALHAYLAGTLAGTAVAPSSYSSVVRLADSLRIALGHLAHALFGAVGTSFIDIHHGSWSLRDVERRAREAEKLAARGTPFDRRGAREEENRLAAVYERGEPTLPRYEVYDKGAMRLSVERPRDPQVVNPFFANLVVHRRSRSPDREWSASPWLVLPIRFGIGHGYAESYVSMDDEATTRITSSFGRDATSVVKVLFLNALQRSGRPLSEMYSRGAIADAVRRGIEAGMEIEPWEPPRENPTRRRVRR